MPQWIHDRARHIQAKNPGMQDSTAFAIATQQAHATGKSPKGYGTTEGRREAKTKYTTPKDDKKTADPGGIGKEAFFRAATQFVTQDQDDRLRHIIREELSRTAPQQPQQPSLKTKKAGLLDSPLPLALIGGFSDYLRKTAQLTLGSVAPKPTVSSQITARMPRNTLSAKTPQYSQVNPASTPGPAQMNQPVLNPPPVRG